jgi:diadenosine tetraphosphate (Ap4A) HIT family hydrolase
MHGKSIDGLHRSSDGGKAMAEFSLHEKLKADTIEVARLDLALLLLMNARQWPWLILVPQRPEIREIHELPALDRTILMDEAAHCSRLLTDLFKPDKINIGALGNIVPQLHVHVIARTTSDPAWPKPVWGTVAPEPYGADELATRLDLIRSRL